MATYAHEQTYSGRYVGSGYIQYNITPDHGQTVGPATQVTISGRVYPYDKALKSIGVDYASNDGFMAPTTGVCLPTSTRRSR